MKVGYIFAALIACVTSIASAQRSTPLQVLHPAGAASDQFGQAIAIDGDTMVVGAMLDDFGAGSNQGSVLVYRWGGSSWILETTLTTTDAASSDYFGSSVAISGDTVIVGAIFDDVGINSNQGSAYIFVRSGTIWTQQAKLTVADGALNDNFGNSVAIAGDTAIVGVAADDVGLNGDQGSAYVFVRSGGNWTQQAQFVASDGAELDNFGRAVAISGDTALVGASLDDVGANTTQGSVYVFVRTGTTWSQQANLTASGGAANDSFGSAVALSGDTALVGAPLDDVGTVIDQGSAYVFTRSGATWTQQFQLIDSDGANSDQMGTSVALSGDSAIIGAPNDDLGSNSGQGSAHVFSRAGTVWSQRAKLIAAGGAANDSFGIAVGISGVTAIVGAHLDDVSANSNQGSTHVFTRVGSTWIAPDMQLLNPAGASFDVFGQAVAISGDSVIVGVPFDDMSSTPDVGTAFIFTRTGGVWTYQVQLSASDRASADNFGISVAISGNTVVIGAHLEDTAGLTDQGAVYVFTRTGTAWTQQAKLFASDGANGDQFGRSVAISGDTIIVGAPQDDTNFIGAQGSAYIFTRSGSTWTQQGKFLASDGAAEDFFGQSVSISGDTAIVGAYGDDVGSMILQGSAYVFTRSGTVWTQQAKLLAPDGAANDYFGFSVAIVDDCAIVGAKEKNIGVNVGQGAAYVFNKTNTNWNHQATLVASDGAANDSFGSCVGISGDTAIVGAPYDNVDVNLAQGSAYVFGRAGDIWTQRTRVVSQDGAADDIFGFFVAIDGDTQIVGAAYDDRGSNPNQGSAWIYDAPAPDFQVARNDSTGVIYSSLAAALLPAVSGQQITATEAAWKRISTLDTAGRSLIFVGNDDIRTPSQSAITLGGSSSILVPAGAVAEFFGQIRVSAGASADITGDSFLLGSRGILTARTNSSLSINAPIAELDGQTRIEQGASLTFAGTATAIGSTTANSDSSLSVGETFNNRDTFTITTGTISAPLFFNHVQSNFFGTSALFGSLFNNLGATTTIRSGTLYVFGSLTNNGTIIGTICSGCTSTPPNMDIGGSLNFGSTANLNMPFLGSTVRVGGNFDCAINSNTRYDMSLATLQLEGNGSEQTLEVMSLDIGADVNGLDRALAGHYPINTLHIGTSPSVVRLVDSHDNDGSGQTVCEAIYVDTLRIEAGSRLINTSCKIYYNTLINNGVIDVPSNVISLQPTFCPSDFDQSGGVDSDDVIAFFGAWDNGDIAADFTQDGGVDSDDVIGFFAAWDAGC